MTVVISLSSESRFPVDRATIRGAVEKMIIQNKVKGKVIVEVTVVGNRKMRSLNKTYRNSDETTTVLSFGYSDPASGATFVEPPDDVLRLGSIVVSYPQAVKRASEDGMMVDDKIKELVEHGMKNLLGVENGSL